MILTLYKNPREFWNEVKEKILVPKPDSVIVYHISDDFSNYKHIKTLKELEEVPFPIVVETNVDYDSCGPSTAYRILTHNKVLELKKKIMDDVLSPYLDIKQKQGK
jgi:hypothetical protein